MSSSRPSLRRRLLFAILLPLAMVFAVSVLLDYNLAKGTADAAFDQALADSVYDLSRSVSSQTEDVNLEMSTEAEAMLRSSPDDRVYFAVRSDDGRLLFGDDGLVPPGDLAATADGEQPSFHDGEHAGARVRIAVMHVGQLPGGATLAVAETVNKRKRASQRILAGMMLPAAGLLLSTLVVVYFGVQRGLSPLADVEHEVARRSPQELAAIDLPAAPREVQPLVARLNELLSMLRDAAAAQRRFLADAAHQLRTPLAGLQTQVELAAHEGRFEDSPERQARIEEAIDRIAHLVQQLLAYASAEPSAALDRRFEQVQLTSLLEQAASLFLDQALARQIDLGFEPAPAIVRGVPWLLQEALTNLVDNALRYAPPGGVVTVSCGLVEGRPRLSVSDNGPGIPEQERERVFDRFYRVAGAPGGGCGLGLSIVKEIADLHGAQVRLGTPPGGGLLVEMLFARIPGQDTSARADL